MKKIIPFILFSAFLYSIACNSKAANSGESVNAEQANEIIAYNNTLIKLNDAQYSYIKSLNKNLSTINERLQDPTNPSPYLSLPFANYINPIKFNDPKPEEPGEFISEEDRKFFQSNVSSLNEIFKNIQTKYCELEAYMKAEDYKDDSGSKGKNLIGEIDALLVKYNKKNDLIVAKLGTLAAGAEQEILKDHPLKDYIFAFKEDSKAVAEFINIAYESPQDYKSIESQLQSSYHKIEKLNQTHSAMKVPDGKAFPARDAAFERFNKSVNDFLAQARKSMREAANTGELSQSDLDAFLRNEDGIRNAYNTFVD